ncbi:MAG TPA: LysE family transporter [Acidimicrobiales bacterium]|nr:LysE family transporter [Acidimicrobiales bacterium]
MSSTTAWGALLAGLGAGFLVAAQVGPIWLLCARSVLRHGWQVGVAIGAGAAIIDVTYATLGVAGTARLLTFGGLRMILGLIGATVLLVLGARTLFAARRVRDGGEATDEVATPRRAFRVALAATASNPATIASWAALFAAASAANLTRSAGSTSTFLLGIGTGSLGWFLILSSSMAILRRRIGHRALQAADVIAGLGVMAFGGLLAIRTVRDR